MTSTQVQPQTAVKCPQWCVEDSRDPGGVYHRGVMLDVAGHEICLNEYTDVPADEKYTDGGAYIVLDGHDLRPEEAALVGAMLLGYAYRLKPDMPNPPMSAGQHEALRVAS